MADDGSGLLDPVDRPMRRLFRYLLPQRGRLSFSVASSILNKLFDLMPPLLVMWFVDIAGDNPPDWLVRLAGDGDRGQAVWLGALCVVIFAFESLFQWMYGYGFMTLAQDTQHRLRLDAYETMQSREMRFFEERRLGRTLSMLNDDVNQLERFLNTALSDIVQLVVLVIFASWALLARSTELAIVGLVPVPFIIYGSLRFSKALEPRYAKVRVAVGELASRLENNIAGILVIKGFTAEASERERVRSASDEYRRVNYSAIRLSTVFVPLIRMVIALGFAASLVLATWWAAAGDIEASTIVLFGMMIQRLLWPLTRLGTTFDEYQRASASAKRVFSLLDTPSRVRDPEAPAAFDRVRGDVAFENVKFDYRGGESVLRGLSFSARAGETVGIAGPTGAGKSTLVKLLLRLYDVDDGAVTIDGIDVRTVTQRDLRRQIAVVTQDVYLFHGTIRENIAYGERTSGGTPDFDDVVHASRVAHLHEFVVSLPGGYDTIVGERGIKLSGGQRQRLSLARAILKDAPILVLDEATSSVDTETERRIQESLAEITAGRTALVIAHRLSTIRGADRIVVLDQGRVAEEGKHDELVATGGLYADLWSVQIGTAEGVA